MEYVYGAMLLHSAGKPVDEAGLGRVMEAAGVEVNDAKIKAVVASLEGVDIDEAVKSAAPVAAAPAAAAPAEAAEAPAEEKKGEGEKAKSEEDAASGLASLFG